MPAMICRIICGALLFSALVGCEGAGSDVTPEKSYRIIEIEGCEYIFVSRRPFAGDMAMAHKGNCKNPIHIYRR